jgi:hypothetical protein
VAPAAGASGRGVVTDPVRDESTAAAAGAAVGEAGLLLLQAAASSRPADDATMIDARTFIEDQPVKISVRIYHE